MLWVRVSTGAITEYKLVLNLDLLLAFIITVLKSEHIHSLFSDVLYIMNFYNINKFNLLTLPLVSLHTGIFYLYPLPSNVWCYAKQSTIQQARNEPSPFSLLKHLSVIYKQQQLANNIDISSSMNYSFE